MPLTDEDLSRICSLKLVGIKEEPVKIIKTGTPGSLTERSFTSALGKRPDGNCQFLSPDNRCQIHLQYAEEAKPSMCRLFPYTFTPTPGGVYASASFASTGLLYNSGRPLTEQRQHLTRTFDLFTRLFPDLRPDWTALQLIDGQPLDFDAYLHLESDFLYSLSESTENNTVSPNKIVSALAEKTIHLIKQKRDYDRIAGVQATARTVDSLIIQSLLRAYFPTDVYRDNIFEIDTANLARSLVMPPDKVLIEVDGSKIGFGELNQYKLGALNSQGESLLRRFAYLKIFSKLYFGPGFAGLSLIAGLNHLSTIISLVRIFLKLKNIESGKTNKTGLDITFEETVECVRLLERRLTVANFSRETKTMLEVLLSSCQRAKRIASLAS
ncbi:MAG: YkgJ family cysteine cluster protein [Candidatus Melainabacteria bacterium]|nr:YkgJ family cysteine cluster protein [Candidatus Melainabacteria bacterium]